MAKMSEATKQYLKQYRKFKKVDRFNDALYAMVKAFNDYDKRNGTALDRDTTEYELDRMGAVFKIGLEELKRKK
jgi:hypothetical protein